MKRWIDWIHKVPGRTCGIYGWGAGVIDLRVCDFLVFVAGHENRFNGIQCCVAIFLLWFTATSFLSSWVMEKPFVSLPQSRHHAVMIKKTGSLCTGKVHLEGGGNLEEFSSWYHTGIQRRRKRDFVFSTVYVKNDLMIPQRELFFFSFESNGRRGFFSFFVFFFWGS